ISTDFTTDWVTIRARYSCTAETYILTKRVGISGQNSSRQRLGSFFAQNGIQMAQCFRYGKGIHLTGAVEARFDSLLQIMSGDLDRQWVRHVMPSLLFKLHPCRMRKSDPDRASTYQELNVHSVRMAGSDGDDHRLELDVNLLPGPAVADSKVV